MSFTNLEGENYEMEIQMDSWEKLNRKPMYEEMLSYAADGHDIEIILPKKCKDDGKEVDYRERLYAEAKEKRQAVQMEGRKKFATKRWLGSFANIGDDVVRAGAGFAGTTSVLIAKYGIGTIVPVLGATLGVAVLGVYAVYEIANFAVTLT